MNDIDNLLGKYFGGVSSTEEEKRLKDYFGGTGILPEHEIYRPLFARFNAEKQVKAPAMAFPAKKTVKRRMVLLVAGSAAAALLALLLPNLRQERPRHPEYIVYLNGKQVVDQHQARQYAEDMFWEADKIVEDSYRPFLEAVNIKEEFDAGKILHETDRKIEYLKTIHKQ